MRLWCDRMSSPIGTVLFVSDGDALRALDFEDCEDRMHRLLRRQYGAFAMEPGRVPGDTRRRLHAYFDGELAALDTIPVRTGGTAFQRRVWTALRTIRAGTDHHIRASGGDAWRAECQPCGRPRQWRQSSRHRCALPSGDWRRRSHRLWRRSCAQGLVAASRGLRRCQPAAERPGVTWANIWGCRRCRAPSRSIQGEDIGQGRSDRLANVLDRAAGNAVRPATGDQGGSEFADRKFDPLKCQLLAMVGLASRNRPIGR